MSNNVTPSPAQTGRQQATSNTARLQWRAIDVVTVAVLGVACGLLFWVWNGVGGTAFTSLDALTPGVGGLVVGVWLLGGTLGGLIVRKPGAAVLTEVIAASVSAVLGSQWGLLTLFSGLGQGVAVEIVLALVLYRRFNLGIAALAGLAAGVGAWVTELIIYGNIAKSLTFNLVYLACLSVSGLVIAGIGAWLMVRALAATGVLDRFAAGREQQVAV